MTVIFRRAERERAKEVRALARDQTVLNRRSRLPTPVAAPAKRQKKVRDPEKELPRRLKKIAREAIFELGWSKRKFLEVAAIAYRAADAVVQKR